MVDHDRSPATATSLTSRSTSARGASVSVTPEECLGRARCPHGEDCFAEHAKRPRRRVVDLVIVNTAPLRARTWRRARTCCRPTSSWCFDEAHEALDIFASLLGTSVSARGRAGLAAAAAPLLSPAGAERADELRRAADRLAAALLAQWRARRARSGSTRRSSPSSAPPSGLVVSIVDELRALSPPTVAGEERKARALGPAIHLAGDLARVTTARDDELVYLEAQRPRGHRRARPASRWRRACATSSGARSPPVLSSATIPDALPQVARPRRRRRSSASPSPFDYAGPLAALRAGALPGPARRVGDDAIVDELAALITAAGGRTLALFTNRRVMSRGRRRASRRASRRRCSSRARRRAHGSSRRSATRPTASLFAVAASGRASTFRATHCRSSRSTACPSPRPDRPAGPGTPRALGQRRSARSTCRAPRCCSPRASGRLIRTREDRGVVAVLDTRLATASYRSALLRPAAPDAPHPHARRGARLPARHRPGPLVSPGHRPFRGRFGVFTTIPLGNSVYSPSCTLTLP